MERLIWDVIFFLTGSVFTFGQVPQNSTTTPVKHPVVAAVRSHFDDCPDSHSQFCFHGTCRFLVQEATPACVCHPGFVGMRCEHADLLALVAAGQNRHASTALLALCVTGCVLLILIFALLHCGQRCRIRGFGRASPPDLEKPSRLLKPLAFCCPSETVVDISSAT